MQNKKIVDIDGISIEAWKYVKDTLWKNDKTIGTNLEIRRDT